MSEDYSNRRHKLEQEFYLTYRFLIANRRIFYLMLIILSLFCWLNTIRSSSNESIPKGETTKIILKTKQSYPTLSRTIYLFLCESQTEVDTYSKLFPSATADAVFYCWREICNATRFRSSSIFYVNTWSSETKQNETLISFEPISTFHRVQSRIFIINEKQLNLSQRLTWTTSRNKLYQFALDLEKEQGWRWSYYVFADGDVHTACPLAEQLLKNKTVIDYGNNEEHVFASRFRSFINLTNVTIDEEKCFHLFNAFLFSVSPAIATISGTSGPMAYSGLLTQIAYHIDAMFNAIHRDALQFLLPYCPRYDGRSWWTSQAIFVYRSLCLYGHVLIFDGLHITEQNHRIYPRVGDPWTMDNDMNLVPKYLQRLQDYMKQNRFVSVLVLHHYSGWNLELTSETCRKHHTSMKIDTCLVYGNATGQ